MQTDEETAEKPPQKSPELPLAVTVERKSERFLDAFVALDQSEETLSYLELPKVSGPEIIVSSVNKLLGRGFYDEATSSWRKVIGVQDAKKRDNHYDNITVYQIKTSVFDGDRTIVVLGRENTVFGYDKLSKKSKVFYIEKDTGRFFAPSNQLELHGKSLDHALDTLSDFQKRYTDVDIDEKTKSLLRSKDVATQRKLTEEYGSDKVILINNFAKTDANKYMDVFYVKVGKREYYITKLIYARLGASLNDDFLEEAWVRIPLDDAKGNLEKKTDPDGLVDYLYEEKSSS